MLTSPLSQSRMPAMTDSRVVLPQPDGPTISVIWPGVDVPVDAAQRLDALLAAAEMLGQTTNPHRDRTGGRRPPRPARSAIIGSERRMHDHHIDSLRRMGNLQTTLAARPVVLNGRRSPARAGSPSAR